MKQEQIEKNIRALIGDNNIAIKAIPGKQYTNELDKLFEEEKLSEKNSVYEQVLVDLQKSESVPEFLLHEVEKSEQNIHKLSEKRKGLRFKMDDSVSIDHGLNGKINGGIIAWNEVLSLCMEASSQSAKLDHISRGATTKN